MNYEEKIQSVIRANNDAKNIILFGSYPLFLKNITDNFNDLDVFIDSNKINEISGVDICNDELLFGDLVMSNLIDYNKTKGELLDTKGDINIYSISMEDQFISRLLAMRADDQEKIANTLKLLDLSSLGKRISSLEKDNCSQQIYDLCEITISKIIENNLGDESKISKDINLFLDNIKITDPDVLSSIKEDYGYLLEDRDSETMLSL